MGHRRPLVALLTAALTLAAAAPALADATVFVGTDTTPSSRLATGVALGLSLVVVGMEFEYAAVSDDTTKGAPSLKTGMFNGFLQTPTPLAGFQPYFTVGGGVYRETLESVHEETGFGSNIGGGVKVNLAGPLRLRVDYRVFSLGSGALYSPAHRFYVGLNLKF